MFKCCSDDENRMKSWMCYREAIWYGDFMPELRKRVQEEMNIEIEIPKTYVSISDPNTGRFFNLMEYFENGKPMMDVLGGEKEEPAAENERIRKIISLSPKFEVQAVMKDVVKKTAEALANWHGSAFMDRTILEKGRKYLKAAPWFFGEGKEQWDRQMKDITEVQNEMKIELTEEWKAKNPLTLRAMEVSASKIDWNAQVA